MANKKDFLKTVGNNFLLYYQPLISWVNRLRKVVFLGSGRQKEKDKKLPF